MKYRDDAVVYFASKLVYDIRECILTKLVKAGPKKVKKKHDQLVDDAIAETVKKYSYPSDKEKKAYIDAVMTTVRRDISVDLRTLDDDEIEKKIETVKNNILNEVDGVMKSNPGAPYQPVLITCAKNETDKFLKTLED